MSSRSARGERERNTRTLLTLASGGNGVFVCRPTRVYVYVCVWSFIRGLTFLPSGFKSKLGADAWDFESREEPKVFFLLCFGVGLVVVDRAAGVRGICGWRESVYMW